MNELYTIQIRISKYGQTYCAIVHENGIRTLETYDANRARLKSKIRKHLCVNSLKNNCEVTEKPNIKKH